MLERTLVACCTAAAVVVAPFAVPEAVADPVAPGVPECPEPDPATGEYPPFDDPVCVSEGEPERGDPTHRLCVSDRFFPLWEGGPVLCAQTYHWRYLPGPGVCAWVFDDFDGDSVACFNGPTEEWDGCVLVLPGVRVLCSND